MEQCDPDGPDGAASGSEPPNHQQSTQKGESSSRATKTDFGRAHQTSTTHQQQPTDITTHFSSLKLQDGPSPGNAVKWLLPGKEPEGPLFVIAPSAAAAKQIKYIYAPIMGETGGTWRKIRGAIVGSLRGKRGGS